MATVILVGNEKGGAGKTTVSIHLTTALLYLGFKVATMDLDLRQGSLRKYLENRKAFTSANKFKIPQPSFLNISISNRVSEREIEADLESQFNEALLKNKNKHDFIIIDTPGTNNALSSLAHSFADFVITPINDSFIDINVLAEVEAQDMSIIKPGLYSQMIWDQKINKAKRDGGHLNWIIVRNRIHSLDSMNQRNMTTVINALSKRMGCKLAHGFGERVIFKELFLKGLTLLDLKKQKTGIKFTASHIAARQELMNLLEVMNDDKITAAMAENII